MCHHSTFLLVGSLQDPTPARWNKVTHASVIVSTLIHSLFGIGGYLTFFSLSQGMMLLLQIIQRFIFYSFYLMQAKVPAFMTNKEEAILKKLHGVIKVPICLSFKFPNLIPCNFFLLNIFVRTYGFSVEAIYLPFFLFVSIRTVNILQLIN